MGERMAKRLVTGVLAGALLPAVVLPGTAHASTDLALPKPTGSHSVGATNLWLKDTSRPDTWVPDKPYRELMVTVWYPTDARRGPAVQYLTPEDSTALLAGKHVEVADPTILSRVRTNAFKDVAPAGGRHSLPLIVLSPGYTVPRVTLTALAEDLASHGYVVAGIDHTGETYATSFPDGHTVGCTTCDLDNQDRTFFGRLYQGRSKDVSFVIDQLTGAHAWRGGELIDASRIGMSGHSAGGAAALASMINDPRIDAGIDMDGTTDTGADPLVPATGFARPFMVLDRADHTATTDPAQAADYAALTGWKRWLSVGAANHQSFTDIMVYAEALGLDVTGILDPLRGVEITRRLNEAMFDKWLRGQPERVLDDPASCYPEVTRI
jgi:predicted dienelactone hydrolase